MMFSFFKKHKLFDWEELDQEELEEEDKIENPIELVSVEFFLIYLRIIKHFTNFFFFTSTNNNNSTYYFFLKFRYNFYSNLTFLLGHFEKNRFQWTNFNFIPYKLFTRIKATFSIQSLLQSKTHTTKLHQLKRIVTFKKKNGFLKKRSKLKNFLLLKVNNLRNFKFFSHTLKKNKFTMIQENFFKKKINPLYDNHRNDVTKFLDLKKRWKKIFSNNRNLLKLFSEVKKTKQFQLTRIFSKFLKTEPKFNFIKTEFSLFNLLLRSKIVFTANESVFLIKNNFVFVNGLCVTNPHFVVKFGDLINISYFRNYFFFYKTNFNQKLKLTYAVGYRLWRLNRFKNNFYKQSPTGIPDWILKLSHFYEDVPSFIEVDYTTLSLTLIKLPLNFYNYNFIFTKFVSTYLLRLYNWKYVI